MKKLMLLGLIIVAFGSLLYRNASADVAIPFTNYNCPPNKTPVYCDPRDNSCNQYTNNSSYQYLSGGLAGSTYCKNTGSTVASAKNLIKPKTLAIYAANFLIECFVAYIFVLLTKRSKQIIAGVLLVNIISWPIFEFVHYIYPGAMVVVVGEILIWLFEATGIYVYCHRNIKLPSALFLSLLTNAVSLSLGFIFLF